jgi:hypothetical protein
MDVLGKKEEREGGLHCLAFFGVGKWWHFVEFCGSWWDTSGVLAGYCCAYAAYLIFGRQRHPVYVDRNAGDIGCSRTFNQVSCFSK